MKLYSKESAAVVIVAIVAMTAATIYESSKTKGADAARLHAIDACVNGGGRAVVSRDGWWCEKPGALP